MMRFIIEYSYYVLLAGFAFLLVFSIVSYLTKPNSKGDASVGWAIGIFYLTALSCVILIALLFWKIKIIGLVFLCLPLLFLSLPTLKNRFNDVYAWFPTYGKLVPLSILVGNLTQALIHVRLECWFGSASGNESFLYKTLDFTVGPVESKHYPLSLNQTALLSRKSKFVSFEIYECLSEEGVGVAYTRQIQPCMQFGKIENEALQSTEFTIIVDAARNTPAFKAEVQILKNDKRYQNGAF